MPKAFTKKMTTKQRQAYVARLIERIVASAAPQRVP